ncbi:MAG: hypothetical protein ACJ72Z_09080 [Pyrinomonadaceae bacterium]
MFPIIPVTLMVEGYGEPLPIVAGIVIGVVFEKTACADSVDGTPLANTLVESVLALMKNRMDEDTAKTVRK